MARHSTLTGAELHEPKGADAASVNTVYVANGAGSGSWSLYNWANLTNRDICLTVNLADVSTASSAWVASPFAGTIVSAYSVINGAITTADAVLSLKIGGVAVTNGSITIANSGSAAGTVDSCTPTALNSVTAGQAIEVATDGASTNTVSATITIVVRVS